MYQPVHLRRWTLPRDYMGAEWEGFYSSGVGRSRDSDALERSNFEAMLQLLEFVEEETPDDCPTCEDGKEYTRVIVRESHWAVGWVEWIAIHESDTAGLEIADNAAGRLADYPILDEALYWDLEWEDCRQVWEGCYRPRERAAYLRDRGPDPKGHFRELRAAVNGSWDSAASLLPCPSDILH